MDLHILTGIIQACSKLSKKGGEKKNERVIEIVLGFIFDFIGFINACHLRLCGGHPCPCRLSFHSGSN